MEISGSEGSSGCESGWTDYLDESFQTPNQYQTSVDDDDARSFRASAYEDEEEDLSMVSDASSGPPHLRYYDDDYEVDYFGKDGFSCSVTKVKSKAEETTRGKHQHSYLDDTANSPAFSCTKSCVDSSNNQASKIKQGNSACSSQFGFWHPKKAEPRN